MGEDRGGRNESGDQKKVSLCGFIMIIYNALIFMIGSPLGLRLIFKNQRKVKKEHWSEKHREQREGVRERERGRKRQRQKKKEGKGTRDMAQVTRAIPYQEEGPEFNTEFCLKKKGEAEENTAEAMVWHLGVLRRAIASACF